MNRNDLNNQHRFGSRSQKGIAPKKSSGGVDRTEQKDSFSVPEDIQDGLPVEFTEEEDVQSAFHGQNALGPHKRMEASRKVLTDFHGSAEIVALQSDGYNAYTFLDNELTDIEHMMTVERKRSSYAGLLPTGRKNSLMLGSHKGAEMSAIFHTFIETCKMNGISTIEYFKKLLSKLLTGNNNYAGLLPQTIGIKR